jgi:hypothetical protein
MSNRQSTIENRQSSEPLGELHITDQLYNALHGVGDIPLNYKIAVYVAVHDHAYPEKKIVSRQEEADCDYRAGRDEIVRIVIACLASVKQIALPILDRWIAEVEAYYAANVARAEQFMADHGIEEINHE